MFKKLEKAFDGFLERVAVIAFNADIKTGKQVREPGPLVKKFDGFWCRLWGVPEEPAEDCKAKNTASMMRW